MSALNTRLLLSLAILALIACDDAPGGGVSESDATQTDATGGGGMGGGGGAVPRFDGGGDDVGPSLDVAVPEEDMEVPEEDAEVPEDDAEVVEEDFGPDFGPDVAPPDERNGGLGEPCPRGFELDCDPEVTEFCVFLGENEALPGVTAVCSRPCDEDENACGAGLCCAPSAQGDRCMPAAFCAEENFIGDACEDNADCPADAPVCVTEAGGARFCSHGCLPEEEDQCPEDFCCEGNLGGDPEGAICKPDDLCQAPCVTDEDCPEVLRCEMGACVPRDFACGQDADCPLAHFCDEEGACQPLEVRALGEACGEEGTACGEEAPVCREINEEVGQRCTYNCSFHLDCPATYCCADLLGLDDPAGLFCTDAPGMCPPALPCRDDEDCGLADFCHLGQCAARGPRDVDLGGACEGPGDCVEEADDCVFQFARGVGRGVRANFPGAQDGICSNRCTNTGECREGECCRIATPFGIDIGVGHCVDGTICEPGMGGGGGRPGTCGNPAHCDPALWNRCVPNAFFGRVCSRGCEANEDCPEGARCDLHQNQCHPIPTCEEDDDCGADNRCAAGFCRLGERQCAVDGECADPVDERCFLGRCEPRARPCNGDNECSVDEVCFAGSCELRDRPCDNDDDCHGGDVCLNNGICGEPARFFGESCVDTEEPCVAEASICFSDVDTLPDGMCTTACGYHSDCPGAACCHDTEGLNDPSFFVCVLGDLCAEEQAVGAHRPCDDDSDCLDEDFCHRGECHDRGPGDAGIGEACAGPGDCSPGFATSCVFPLEFGYAVGAEDSIDALGPGACQPACENDGECGSGCCRHADVGGAPVGFCVDFGMCPAAGDAGDGCFAEAHEECDPATSDACVYDDGLEDFVCR